MAWMHELYWAAGFLEGEGSFTGSGIGSSTSNVNAGQKIVEPLLRLQRLFGGAICQNKTGMFTWAVSGKYARGVMMTLFPLLSARRQAQSSTCLAKWRYHIPTRGMHARLRTHCDRGHALTEENIYHPPGRPGVRTCRQCKNMMRKVRRNPAGNPHFSARDHCKHGHPYTPSNTYFEPRRPRTRMCRTCHNQRANERYHRLKLVSG